MGSTTTTVVDDDDKEVAAKVYHGIPGSNFIGKMGEVNSFDAKGRMEVTSQLLQKELDKVANKPGTGIYSDDKAGPVPEPQANKPVDEIKAKAAATVAALQQSAANQNKP